MKALVQAPVQLGRAHDARLAHPLFQRFPIAGSARISVGTVSTPYHVYDGHGVFVGGTADLKAARALLAGEQVNPVATEDGRALMGVWVFEFNDASLGAHHELQCSIFVSHAPTAPLPAHPLAPIEAMVVRPEVKMLCHGLWNNTERVVAYNRELLGLNARLSDSRIVQEGGCIHFSVHDRADGAPVVQGCVRETRRTSLRASLSLMHRLGWRRLAALAREPWIHAGIVNPIGDVVPHNAVADSYTRADTSVLRHFDGAHDRVAFRHAGYQALGFVPQFVQTMRRFKFVYLFPR
jgi:hypothetical protein